MKHVFRQRKRAKSRSNQRNNYSRKKILTDPYPRSLPSSINCSPIVGSLWKPLENDRIESSRVGTWWVPLIRAYLSKILATVGPLLANGSLANDTARPTFLTEDQQLVNVGSTILSDLGCHVNG